VKTGIYTEGREWKTHEPSIFLGINAEKFHNTITKYAKKWYMVAVPLALTLGMTVYGALMAIKPDAKVEEAAHSTRKKTHWDYAVKYYGQGQQKVKEVTSGSSGTLDDKVDRQEATK
jgi:hypothetical protein